MRILMVSAAILPFWKCGVATVVDDLRLSLQEKGYTVAMFALDLVGSEDRVVTENDAQCWMTAATANEQRAYIADSIPDVAHVNRRFEECLNTFHPDIVHFHTPQYFSLSLITMAKNAGARTIVTLHDWWWICPAQFFTPYQGHRCQEITKQACLECMKKTKEDEVAYEQRMTAMKAAEPAVDCFTCVSSILYDDLIKEKPYLIDKICVIPNAISERSEEFSQIDGPLTFAFLGGQHEIKGYAQIISAFSQLSVQKNWQLNIYGCAILTVPPISLLKKVRKYIFHPRMLLRKVRSVLISVSAEMKNELPIHHYPVISKEERTKVLKKTHVVLVCSQVQESFSLVTYEAMASGCCVIASPCSGPMAVVKDGVNGLQLQSSDGDALTEAVRYMLDNRGKVEEFRRNAYEESKSFMGRKSVAESYINIYNKRS